MCINPASPLDLLEFKSCGCQSDVNRCNRLTCNCFKNGLQCCDLCTCGEGCKNLPERKMESDDSEDLLF